MPSGFDGICPRAPEEFARGTRPSARRKLQKTSVFDRFFQNSRARFRPRAAEEFAPGTRPSAHRKRQKTQDFTRVFQTFPLALGVIAASSFIRAPVHPCIRAPAHSNAHPTVHSYVRARMQKAFCPEGGWLKRGAVNQARNNKMNPRSWLESFGARARADAGLKKNVENIMRKGLTSPARFFFAIGLDT